MRNAVKFLISLVAAFIVLLLVRALAFTVYTIPDKALEPTLLQGDRVIVNRWSYGLRTGGDSLFCYARIMKSPVRKGDFIAFYSPVDTTKKISSREVFIGKVNALPGDTITVYGKSFVLPKDCQACSWPYQAPYAIGSAKSDCLLLVPGKNIIGRACLVVYNFHDGRLDKKRWLKLIP
ncbi:signal peptidase I [Prevotella sp. KH2C16]|uniref:signal peptidase I n=1 Tax=Prevotella sp. KH2C16 TaxID=1855325 RepID=UPI0008E3921A|nr:signal peptidase I [Prevotella sp. KH2C16]SFF82188.1 signal peptidase I [Prevotella sp. KH2C16]